MEIANIATLQQNPDGTFILIHPDTQYLPEMQYSHDGHYYWESVFNAYEHESTTTPGVTIGPHKYARFRLNPESEWSNPIKMVGEDGVPIVLKNTGTHLAYKYTNQSDEELVEILELEDIKGEDGRTGKDGRGLQVCGTMFWDELNLLQIKGSEYLVSAPGCQRDCYSPSNTNDSSIRVILCLGDNRTHNLNSGDDSGTYFLNGTDPVNDTWIEYSSIYDGREVTYYGASDDTGTGAVDARTEDTLSKKGKIYVWDGTLLTELSDLAAPVFRLAPDITNAIQGLYMNDYIDASTCLEMSPSFVIDIADDAVSYAKLDTTIFTNGLTASEALDSIFVDPSEFTGFGLDTYVSGDYTYQQLDLTGSLGDGIAEQSSTVDGDGAYTEYIIRVNPADLVHSTGTAIGVFTNSDGYDDFKILKDDKSITINGSNQVEVLPDDESIEIKTIDPYGIHIKHYDGVASSGVQKKHINPNVADTTKGLKKDDSSDDGQLYVLVDDEYFEFDSGDITIKDASIPGTKLTDSFFGDGIERSGESAKLDIDTTYFQLLDTDADTNNDLTIQEDAFVLSITTSDLLKNSGDISIPATSSTYIDVSTQQESEGIITINADLKYEELKSALESDGFLTSSETVYWETLEYSSGDSTTIGETILQAIADADHAELDTWYGDSQINSTHGLVLRPSGGSETYKLIVGSDGTLDTESVTL